MVKLRYLTLQSLHLLFKKYKNMCQFSLDKLNSVFFFSRVSQLPQNLNILEIKYLNSINQACSTLATAKYIYQSIENERVIWLLLNVCGVEPGKTARKEKMSLCHAK